MHIFCVLVTSPFSRVGCCEQLLAVVTIRVSPLAGSLPSMGTRAGLLHTNGCKLCFLSASNLPLIICRYHGCTVTFSTALTSLVSSYCVVASGWGLARSCSFIRSVPLCLGSVFRPASFSENAVRATCPVWGALNPRRVLFMSFIDIFPGSKSNLAPNRLNKSVPNRPAAEVGSEHTRKGCVNLLPFIWKVTVYCPLISRVSPFTP